MEIKVTKIADGKVIFKKSTVLKYNKESGTLYFSELGITGNGKTKEECEENFYKSLVMEHERVYRTPPHELSDADLKWMNDFTEIIKNTKHFSDMLPLRTEYPMEGEMTYRKINGKWRYFPVLMGMDDEKIESVLDKIYISEELKKRGVRFEVTAKIERDGTLTSLYNFKKLPPRSNKNKFLSIEERIKRSRDEKIIKR